MRSDAALRKQCDYAPKMANITLFQSVVNVQDTCGLGLQLYLWYKNKKSWQTCLIICPCVSGVTVLTWFHRQLDGSPTLPQPAHVVSVCGCDEGCPVGTLWMLEWMWSMGSCVLLKEHPGASETREQSGRQAVVELNEGRQQRLWYRGAFLCDL